MWTGSKQQIADMCRIMSDMMAFAVPGVDSAQMWWAIAGNESSFGHDCTPRHEPAFDVGGVYGNGEVMKPLLAKWGRAAACSYGPWQIMFCNTTIMDFVDFDDLSKTAKASVVYLNLLNRKFRMQTLAQVGECWNGGHPMVNPSVAVAGYVQRLTANYQNVPILPEAYDGQA